MGSLQHRARFLCEFTLFAEEEDSSIVPLHGRLSDLVSEACGGALASGALSALAGLSWRLDGWQQV